MEIFLQKEKWLKLFYGYTPIVLITCYLIYKAFMTDERLVYLIGILVISAVAFISIAKVRAKNKIRYKATIFVGDTHIHLNAGLDGTVSHELRYLSNVEDERDNLVLTFQETDVPLTIRKVAIPKSKFAIDDMYKLKCLLIDLLSSQPNKIINGTPGGARH